jgi:hypothetical protein
MMLCAQKSTNLLDELANDPFRVAGGIHIGSVNRVETTVPSGFQDLERFLLFEDPWSPIVTPETHCTNNGYGNTKASFTKLAVFDLSLVLIRRHDCF